MAGGASGGAGGGDYRCCVGGGGGYDGGDSGDSGGVFAVVDRGGLPTVYYATVLCGSCQLPLRTHCAPILSNTTSAGVVNTTEEKVPNDEKLLLL